jgi:hypothetical protein
VVGTTYTRGSDDSPVTVPCITVAVGHLEEGGALKAMNTYCMSVLTQVGESGPKAVVTEYCKYSLVAHIDVVPRS